LAKGKQWEEPQEALEYSRLLGKRISGQIGDDRHWMLGTLQPRGLVGIKA
jgi:hypothetical protein